MDERVTCTAFRPMSLGIQVVMNRCPNMTIDFKNWRFGSSWTKKSPSVTWMIWNEAGRRGSPASMAGILTRSSQIVDREQSSVGRTEINVGIANICRGSLRDHHIDAMSTSAVVHTCALPPHLAWASLVSRSITTWEDPAEDYLAMTGGTLAINFARSVLRECHSLDDYLTEAPGSVMLWFFQRREAFMSQNIMRKWSRDELDDYILLPALPNFVLRKNCFFVSHFWRMHHHPDPDGQYLRLHQAQLEPQTWQYIWVDWTCMPQNPRSLPEQLYFDRCLRTMSGIIRNCGFIHFYPPFKPRLWILYEITEYVLTCVGGLEPTSDNEQFLQHIDEMLDIGVQATLSKHDYVCSFEPDRHYLVSWLELLILLKQIHLDVDSIRKIMDDMTWYTVCGTQTYSGLVINRFQGTLVANGRTHTFTPFPNAPLDDAQHSYEGLA